MNFWANIFLSRRFFRMLLGLCLGYILGYWFPVLLILAHAALVIMVVILIAELRWLFNQTGISARRECADRFSNGDPNPVKLTVSNHYGSTVRLRLIDELPVQFQYRDNSFRALLKPGATQSWEYHLRPQRRGVYAFGKIRVYASLPMGLLQRRYSFAEEREVAVYPSFLHLRQYELQAISHELRMTGVKKIRRPGHSREFEQVERYVTGDDYRKINWKATARRNRLMINHYQDERSQNVLIALDKGRAMEMPFGGMSLLDYAINASLMLSNIALRKGDRAGLVSFQHRIESSLLPQSRPAQMHRIMEMLYREETSFLESDLGRLYGWLGHWVKQRSLVVLFTNYESIHSLRRQMPYLRMINKRHLLLVVLFKNTVLDEVIQQETPGIASIYRKGLAEQLVLEKRLIVRELQRAGIQCLLSPPEELTIGSINKYLEIKTRGLL